MHHSTLQWGGEGGKGLNITEMVTKVVFLVFLGVSHLLLHRVEVQMVQTLEDYVTNPPPSHTTFSYCMDFCRNKFRVKVLL